MEKYFYYSGIRKTVLQFLDIFNDMEIAKYNAKGEVEKYVKIPIKLAPKEKYYQWVNSRTHEKRFPSMAAHITGITPEINNRAGNKRMEFTLPDGTKKFQNLIPINLSISLYITSLYIHEMDQILEQIIPFFTPYVMTRVSLPEIDEKFNVKVIFDDAAQDIDINISSDEQRKISWTLSFSLKTFLLKPVKESKRIHEIFLSFRDLQKIKDPEYQGVDLYETIHLSGGMTEENKKIINYEILNEEIDE